MVLEIKKDDTYAESNVTYIGLARKIYGYPQFILVNSDEGTNPRLKFPGLRFRAPQQGQTLEDVARERFEEQTGLKVLNDLGLRAIIPTRSRHGDHWIFRNVCVGVVDGTPSEFESDGRKVYLANAGEAVRKGEGTAYEFGNSKNRIPIEWVAPDNQVVARLATNVLNYFDWKTNETSYLRRIPCVSVPPQIEDDTRNLGCGLAVSTTMLLYRPHPQDSTHIILLKRKGDKFSGFVGGKIETPVDTSSKNIDPISCCSKEGEEEFGFPIHPLSLLGVACTPLQCGSENEYNSIVTYAFISRPTNPLLVEKALRNPGEHLEEQMEAYDVVHLKDLKDRAMRGELRMPDNIPLANLFFKKNPGERISLEQIIDAGGT